MDILRAFRAISLGEVLCGFLLFGVSGGVVAAQSTEETTITSESEAKQPELVLENSEATSEGGSQRTELNLLGQVDAASGEGQRNENVSVALIDNNVLKELNQRMGTTATIVREFQADRKYFGKEYGGSASGPLHVTSRSSRDIHGSLHWTHTNSIFKARSFFQVGNVQPSRSNDYGVTLTTPLWTGGHLTIDGEQTKNRGQVNGNILVPGADERTPTTTDPEELAIVNSILGSYPDELPNRTDINKRALNTNGPQNIDDHHAGATYDQEVGENDRLLFRYNLTLQSVDAFQLVGGQNPDTETKNHDSRITWTRVWNPSTTTDFSTGYNRVSSVLSPDESSLGIVYLFGRSLQTIGPSSAVPLNRAQDTFRYAGRLQRTSGNHTFDGGFDLGRRQINGFESNNNRGLFIFRSDFGRERVENLLAGTPSGYRQAIGNTHRGFRAWMPSVYIGDVWRASTNLTVNYGLRYEIAPTPTEVNNLSEVPYDCACNNLAPRFGFAYRLSDRWGILRASYGIHYGEIFSTTYMQSRFNPPGILNLNIDTPDLVDPLKDFSVEDLDPNQRTDFFRLDRGLTNPYSHQYNFTWELSPYRDWTLELGYVGSRTHKLLDARTTNRAQHIEDMEVDHFECQPATPGPAV